MRAITHKLLTETRQINGPVLELGCGSGVFLREMSERNPTHHYFGIDRYGVALSYANQQPAALHLAKADLGHLPFANDSFSLLVALDVFDQRAVDLHQALQESWRILRPGGLLLLRVSAYPWLQSAHDHAFNTGRRYARQEMGDRIHAAAFDLERVTYANTLMALPIIAQRLLQRWGLLAFSSNHAMSPLVNQQVARLLGWEAHLLHQTNLPFGISLYTLARKPL